MDRYDVHDILGLEDLAGSTAALTARLGEVIYHSTNRFVGVEAMSGETGQYRLILEGTIGQGSMDPEAGEVVDDAAEMEDPGTAPGAGEGGPPEAAVDAPAGDEPEIIGRERSQGPVEEGPIQT